MGFTRNIVFTFQYPTTNGQFSRTVSHQQQPMVQSTYSYPAAHQYIQYPQVPSTTPDSTAALVTELQQMTLRHPTPQQDWQVAVTNPTVTVSDSNGVLYYQANHLYNQRSSQALPIVPLYQDAPVNLQYPQNEPILLEESVAVEEVTETITGQATDGNGDALPSHSVLDEAGNEEAAMAPVLCSTVTV